MCEELFQVLDKVKLSNTPQGAFACHYSDDRRISLLCDKGFYILELHGNTENWLPIFSFIKTFCMLQDYSINANVGIDINDFIEELPQFEVYEAVLNRCLSENLKNCAPTPAQPISALWSPSINNDTGCILAVLNNSGVVQVFWKNIVSYGQDEYRMLNVTHCIINHFQQHNWKNLKLVTEKKFLELKRRVSRVAATAITWRYGCDTSGKNYCCLIIGHLDGGISTWKLENTSNDLVCTFVDCFESSLPHITALHWVPTNDSGTGFQFFGNKEGKIGVMDVSNEEVIYPIEDNINVDCIKLITYKDYMLLIAVKNCSLLIALINKQSEFVDQKLVYCGPISITGIEHYEENIIWALNCTLILKQIKIDVENNQLVINLKELHTDTNWKKYRSHGFILSPNRVFLGVLVDLSHLKESVKKSRSVMFMILRNKSKKPVDILLQNHSETLENYWDCFETLRVQGLKFKEYPCEEYPFILTLNYDKLNILELKTMMYLSKITETVYRKKPRDINRNIEVSTIFEVIINFKLAVQHIRYLLHLHSTGVALTTFQMNTLEMLDGYIREIIAVDILQRYGLLTNTMDELYELMTYMHNLKYPQMAKCFWCDTALAGSSCCPPHSDMRCAISQMQITGIPAYKCRFCSCVLHKEMEKYLSAMFCPYCDIPMCKNELHDANVAGPLSEFVSDQKRSGVCEDCYDDCSSERVNLADVSDKIHSGVIDSELCCVKWCPNWDELTVSDISSDEEEGGEVGMIERIFKKELNWMKDTQKTLEE